MKLESALEQWFGYSSFRFPQKEIIQTILDGKQVLALLPTGTGKSICYQLPGLLLPGTTLVISPLIALMVDQVAFLHSKKISALALTGNMSPEQLGRYYADISQGVYKFLFIAPERLHSHKLQELLQRTTISLIAIDEAHCISQWGHDFRPEYHTIGSYLKTCNLSAPILALTATATLAACQDIIASLQLTNCQTFQTSFIRSNLTIRTYYCKNTTAKILRMISICKLYHNEVGIIYVSTRKDAEYLAAIFRQLYWLFTQPVTYYHAGLTDDQRKHIQHEFVFGSTQLIIATTAFGMGINKANVRLVIHFSAPASLEQYYQEIGRAGRDGKTSDTFLLWAEHDFAIHDRLLQKSNHYQYKKKLLTVMRTFLKTTRCRNEYIGHYFGEKTTPTCHHCDNCQNLAIMDLQSLATSFAELHKLRRNYADLNGVHEYAVLTDAMVWWLLVTQPTTANQFLALPGFGQGWLKSWQQLIPVLHDILQAYEYDHSATR